MSCGNLKTKERFVVLSTNTCPMPALVGVGVGSIKEDKRETENA